jgi:hypothetical protein
VYTKQTKGKEGKIIKNLADTFAKGEEKAKKAIEQMEQNLKTGIDMAQEMLKTEAAAPKTPMEKRLYAIKYDLAAKLPKNQDPPPYQDPLLYEDPPF